MCYYAAISWSFHRLGLIGRSNSGVLAAHSRPSNRVSHSCGFDPDNFSNSAAITNPYFPMTPGTTYRWEGQAFDERDKVTRAIEFTVTNLTKEINAS